MSNKKGIFAMLTVLGIASIIVVLIFAQGDAYKLNIEIGQLQSSTLDMYAEGQFARNYMKNAAELSLRNAAKDLAQDGEVNKEEYTQRVINYFENYLKLYPSDLELPASEESLYDMLNYEYEIGLSPASFRALPRDERLDVPILNDDGSVTLKEIVVPTKLKFTDYGFGITYEASAYVEAEVPELVLKVSG